ncbi:MAG: aspartate--tRNA ligase [Candidatus Saccharibacteria bacterium]|nr:aspartate--tRNA ligase [Candidatus Saccharibacteria bacterium]
MLKLMMPLTPTRDLNKVFQSSDQSPTVAGWVQARRDHGGLIFIDLRDCHGIIQIVFRPENKALFDQAQTLRKEWVIEVGGRLQKRTAGMENPLLATGQLEIAVDNLIILNQAKTPPITTTDQAILPNEDKRLKYRYLDLRRPTMQKNLKYRASFYKVIRDFMEEAEFTEVPTPILANSSPEGARDFLVPSRLHQGKFYALPQAPQQFKQLLMVGGLSRYYQIASCFRDEDPRADRLYGDFYQLDLEMSFVSEGRVVRQTVEPLVKKLIVDFGQMSLLGDKFFEMTYRQAFEAYGTDKPDLRYDLKIQDLSTIFKSTEAEVLKKVLEAGGSIKSLAIDSTLSNKQFSDLIVLAQSRGAKGLAWLTYTDQRWQGPLAKFLSIEELKQIRTIFKLQNHQTVFLLADQSSKLALTVLGAVREQLADWLNLKNEAIVSAVWIVDFPFYEQDEQSGQLVFGHNPFSKPKNSLDNKDKLQILADQYDLVLNGYEVCSGAVRNHDPKQLILAFQNIGYSQDEVEQKFGALLEAFQYGAPPHAGCAFGLDRLLMILLRESNIRQLVAFPKSGSGVDLMMDSPSNINKTQAKELGIHKS